MLNCNVLFDCCWFNVAVVAVCQLRLQRQISVSMAFRGRRMPKTSQLGLINPHEFVAFSKSKVTKQPRHPGNELLSAFVRDTKPTGRTSKVEAFLAAQEPVGVGFVTPGHAGLPWVKVLGSPGPRTLFRSRGPSQDAMDDLDVWRARQSQFELAIEKAVADEEVDVPMTEADVVPSECRLQFGDEVIPQPGVDNSVCLVAVRRRNSDFFKADFHVPPACKIPLGPEVGDGTHLLSVLSCDDGRFAIQLGDEELAMHAGDHACLVAGECCTLVRTSASNKVVVKCISANRMTSKLRIGSADVLHPLGNLQCKPMAAFRCPLRGRSRPVLPSNMVAPSCVKKSGRYPKGSRRPNWHSGRRAGDDVGRGRGRGRPELREMNWLIKDIIENGEFEEFRASLAIRFGEFRAVKLLQTLVEHPAGAGLKCLLAAPGR